MTGGLVVHSPLDAFEICEELGEVVISKVNKATGHRPTRSPMLDSIYGSDCLIHDMAS